MFGYSHFTGGFAGGQAEVRYITPTNLGHFQRAEHEGMILDPTQDPPLQKHVSGAWLLELLEPYLVYYTNAREQYVRVPYGDVNLLKLPDSVPDEKGLYLSDVICTSWNCVVDTGVEKGDVVAIWGAGESFHLSLILEMHTTDDIRRSYWTDVRRLCVHQRCIASHHD